MGFGFEHLSPNGVQQNTFNEGAKGRIKEEKLCIHVDWGRLLIYTGPREERQASMPTLKMEINLRVSSYLGPFGEGKRD